MNRQDAEKNITEYLKTIFAFTLKKCKNAEDAEDLSQEIVLKAYRALLTKDDIGDVGKFVWTIAHNALSNYYRDTSKAVIGVSLEDVAEIVVEPDLLPYETDDSILRLQSEIAYLSKLQRKIVIAYYFENRKQSDIAEELNIPLGTVKWHLFESKKELKRGIKTMRKTSELKFNPIKFNSYRVLGTVGSMNLEDFFHSRLLQNICYCVRNEAKTINEIADDLGVSPVFVESEVDVLTEFCFLKEEKGKYIINFFIDELTADVLIKEHEMYKNAAELFANELYDELILSGLLENPDVLCGENDKNFIMWSLIPYIISTSSDELIDGKTFFEEVADIRPDGSRNVFHAYITPENMVLPKDYVHKNNLYGPFMYESDKCNLEKAMFWQLDTEWSESRVKGNDKDVENAERILSLYKRGCGTDFLSQDEYAWLAEQGYIRINGNDTEPGKVSWQIVTLANPDIKNKLIEIGKTIATKHKDAFCSIKADYVKTLSDAVPTHLRKVKEYELQFLFHYNGYFILHCMVELLNKGKIQPPTEEQKKALTTIIVFDK